MTALLMCQSFYTPHAKWWCLLHRWPGPVRSGTHQRALWECRGRDQQRSAERRLLCGRSGTAVPRHPSRKSLRSPSVALLHHLSARSHPSPQQSGLQHGQSGGAGRAGRRGTGSEGHGRGPNLRPLHRQQYRIPRLPYQPRLMAGRDGPFPVLSLEHSRRSLWGYDKTDTAFYISFYHPPRLVCFVILGEEEKEEKKCDSQSVSTRNGEVTTGLRCAVWIKAVKNTSTPLNVQSISTLYHTIFVITWLCFVLSLWKWDWISNKSVDFAHRGGPPK